LTLKDLRIGEKWGFEISLNDLNPFLGRFFSKGKETEGMGKRLK